MKICSVCNVEKPLSEYYPLYSSPGCYRKYCKKCYGKGVTPTIKLANSMRRHLKRIINSKNTNIKSNNVKFDVGCSWVELKNHIENQFQEGMNWGNWSLHGWHIDHIKPISKGGSNHYTNLQPLWAKDNLRKSNH